MAKPLLTVITPVYNEQEVISAFYERTKAVLRLCAEKYDTRILFVVDRGTDRTLDILQEISREDKVVQIVSLSARFGHQMSLLAGIDAAKYSTVSNPLLKWRELIIFSINSSGIGSPV